MPTVTYTNTTITGYNTTPPPDDGTQDSSNEITWSRIKTQLTDPLNTAIASIDTNVETAIAAFVACLGVTAASPSFAANKGGVDQTQIPSGTYTKLVFPVEEYDNAGDYDASVSTWTPSEAGEYEIGGAVEIDPDSHSGVKKYILACYKNGSFHKLIGRVDIASGGLPVGWTGTTTVKVNGTTDYLEVYMRHETGSPEQIRGKEGRANIWGFRIS